MIIMIQLYKVKQVFYVIPQLFSNFSDNFSSKEIIKMYMSYTEGLIKRLSVYRYKAALLSADKA